MRTISTSCVSLFLCSIFLWVDAVHAQQPQATQIAPAKITLRGISIADFSHSMCVGDSATVLINLDSTNITGNRTWNLLPSPISKNRTFYGVSYYDSLHAIVIGDAGLILRTNDEAANWTQISKGLTGATLRSISQIADGTFAIVGDSGVILRSVDSGITWSRVNSGTQDTLFAVTFGSSHVGIAVGEKGTAIKTIDGGLTWSTVPGLIDPKINFYGVTMSGEDSAIVVGDSARIRYTNDGVNWETTVSYTGYPIAKVIEKPLANPLYAVTFTGANPDTSKMWAVASGRDDFFYQWLAHLASVGVTTKRDTTWFATDIRYIRDADGVVQTVSFRMRCAALKHFGTNILLEMAGDNGRIADFPGVPNTFGLDLPSDPIYSPNALLFVSIDNAGNGFGTGIGGIIYRTTDNGFHWHTVFTNPFSSISGVHCFDSNTAIVAGWSGTTYRTTNGGKRWNLKPQSLHYKLHAFAFPAGGIGVCVGDLGTILHSTDSGATWKDVSDHAIGQFLNNVAFSDPSTGVLIGQNATVRRTTDGGLTWPETPPTPLDNYPTASLKYIDAFPDGTYFIGADSGVIKSVDRGKNWSLIAAPPCSLGTSFYNSKIGVVGEFTTSSATIADTVVLKYTRDGGVNWSDPFRVPILNANRLVTHWLDSHTFLLYGTDGFIVKVDLSGPNVVTRVVSNGTSPLRVYPNPSHGKTVNIEYEIENEGPVSIDLLDELGRKVSSLFAGTETPGTHSRTLAMPPDLHGSYIVSLVANGVQRTLKVITF